MKVEQFENLKIRSIKDQYSFFILGCLMLIYVQVLGQRNPDLEKIKWIHGSADCGKNRDPNIQVVQYDDRTWIFRQNKCVHYEAPFIYLFVGNKQALLVDTGARAPKGSFLLYDSVSSILLARTAGKKPLSLKVIHTHSHGDHTAGDNQFRNLPNVQLVGPTRDSISLFLHITNWPEQQIDYDLGNRKLTFIPIPGHDQASIAIYDTQTRWLLTGDTVYPGRLYVRDWPAYQASISRLLKFSEEHSVSFLMGNHIEMSRMKGVDYPVGTKYQPDEQTLPMKVDVLRELNEACVKMGEQPRKAVHNDFIIEPVN